MQSYKKLLIVLVLTFGSSSVFANNIEVATFDELINSHPLSGDTIQIVNNLTSTSTIGSNFSGININFDGQNFLMDGENAYGGFLLDKDSVFSQIKMTNFKGQLESGTSSYYAGAIYNEGGAIDVNNSYFANNYADSERINFGAGGAIYNMQNSTMNINSTVFESLTATTATAIACLSLLNMTNISPCSKYRSIMSSCSSPKRSNDRNCFLFVLIFIIRINQKSCK